ncbi:substrate-binding domain-containing protein, partial [bacterium]|nr:substrate-binding domain-containing protein [bacterium]
LKSFLRLVILAFVCTGFSGPATTAGAENENLEPIRSAGCRTAYFLIRKLGDGYHNRKHIPVIAKRSGNKIGIKLLYEDAVDFVFACQPHTTLIKKYELDPQRVKNWTIVKVAKDPIVVVVHRTNRVRNLTLNQLNSLFRGEIKNWRELGGADIKVQLACFDGDADSGVDTVFREETVGREPDGTLRELSTNSRRFSLPKQLGAFVSQNQGAVTYMGLNSHQKRYGTKLKIDAIAPTRKNILNDTYPITATYYIIYDKHNKARVEPFLDFAISKEGMNITSHDFITAIEKNW